MNRFCLLVLLCFVISPLVAQQTMSIGTTQTDPDAVLWLVGDGTQGLVIPIVTSLGTFGKAGMIAYNQADNKLYYNNGGSTNNGWVELGGGGANGSAYSLRINPTGKNAIELLENGIPTGSVTLSQKSEGPAANEFLVYDGTQWTSVNLTQDAVNNNGTITVNGLKGKVLPDLSAITSSQVLTYDGTNWIFQPLPAGGDAQDLSLIGTTLSLTNDATPVTLGVLSTLNTVGTDQITDGSITGVDIADTSIPAGKLSASGATINGQVLKWNSTTSKWEPGPDNVGPPSTLPDPGAGQLITDNAGTNVAVTVSGDMTFNGAGNMNINTTTAGTNIVTAINNSAGVVNAARIANIDASKITTGILTEARGGTGVTTAANGQLLIGDGAGFSLGTLTAGTGISITNGAGSIQVSSTGLNNPMTTSGDLIFRNGATNDRLPIGTAGQVLTVTGGLPSWQTPSVTSATIANNTIVDADVSTTAAIAGTKITPAFGAQNISTSGTLSSGDITSSGTITATNRVVTADLNINGLDYTWPNALPPSNAFLSSTSTGVLSWSALPSTSFSTANVIPKGDGVSGLTSSQIFDDGTNVGIGTTTPATKLQVEGALSSLLRLKGTGTTPAAQSILEIGHDDGSGGYTPVGNIGDPGSGDYLEFGTPYFMTFNTNFATRMTIANNGSVSMATPLTGNTLLNVSNLNGTAPFSAITGTLGARIVATDDTEPQVTGLELRAAGNGAGTYMGGYISAVGTGSGQNRGLVTSGRGSTGFNYGLEAFANGNTGFNYGIQSTIGGTQNSTKYGLSINASGNGTKYGVYSNGEDQNYFSGKLGLGTNAPVNRLDVEGGLAVGTGYSGTNTAPTDGAIIEGSLGLGTTIPVNKLDVEGGLAVGATYSGTNSAPTDGAIIQGDVGIGTTSVDGKFHVAETVTDLTGVEGAFINVQNTNNSGSAGYMAGIRFRADGVGAGANARYKSGIFHRKTDTFGVGDLIFAVNNAASNASVTAHDVTGDTRMIIKSTGDVGIGTGTSAPFASQVHIINEDAGDYVLNLENTNSTATGMIRFTRSGSNFSGAITESGGTVTYGAFTGAHYAHIDQPIEMGMLVTLTGSHIPLNSLEMSEPVYDVTISTKANDSKLMGCYFASLQEASATDIHQIMAVGNGVMWVIDNGTDLQVGDYLISSSIAGHAMKDNGNYDIAYIIGRVAEPVEWKKETDSINGIKRKRISVFFESFELSHKADRLEMELKQLKEEVELLKKMMGLEAKK